MKKIFILLVISHLLIGCFSSTSSKVDKLTLMTGHNVFVVQDCFGSVSEETFNKLVSYTATQNVPAAEQMRQAGLFVVLRKGDMAELEKVTTGWVKMKMNSGLLKGRSVYTFRESVEKR